MSIRNDHKVAVQATLQGRYEILSKLGAGGFGTVFKARQVATGQPVAIKILKLGVREGAAAAKRVRRFRREMQLCAQLHHTNIVRLIDSGETDERQTYLVFEFIPGRNLHEILKEEGRLDPFEARHLLLQVVDALACAHAQGVIHRDLKPPNIMVVPTGARRNAVVLDFGIGALAEDKAGPDDARLTGEREMLGTPAYSAPEQLLGRPATARADLFAWGLVFLECLTGEPVFSGQPYAEILARQASPEPIPMPTALRNHAVGRLLSRALLKDVEARDVTAGGLLRDLEACDMRGLRGAMQAAATPVLLSAKESERPASGGARDEMSAPEQRSDSEIGGEREGECRLITAVCCSLAVSARELEAVNIEEQDDLLRWQQELCGEVARRFQGTIAGMLGERVLLYFGSPTAREDDAERAARCALEIVARTGEQCTRIERERQLTMAIGLGVHTGLVITCELHESAIKSAGPLVGGTASIAAQLSLLAQPGTVLISGDACSLLRARFVTEELGAHPLGHGTKPVDVYRLRGERSVPAAMLGGDAELPMIGRSHEIALLQQCWSRARDGFGQSILITGEPGIGKSRLALELCRALDGEEHAVLECRCVAENQLSTLRPIIDLLEQMFDLVRDSAPEQKISRIEAFLTNYGFNCSETMPLLAALLSLPLGPRYPPVNVTPQRQKELTVNALLSLLVEASERQPLLFVVEDLQWADSTTLDLLALLVASVSSTRICALLISRSEFSSPWRLPDTLQIQLGRLDGQQVRDMIMGVTGGKSLPDEVVEKIVRQTDGVPLFVEALTRTVVESGALVEREYRYVLARLLSDLPIPTTLRSSLTARLDRLGRARGTAQIASALGREFSAELLAAVSPLGESAVQADLRRLIAADLISVRRRARGSTHLFKHALIRDAAYGSLSKRARQKLHARIARTLEERFVEVTEQRPELLALHHSRAAQTREAIKYAQASAERALVQSANSEAIEYARQAISWLDAMQEPHERAELELGLNGVMIHALMATRGDAAEEVEEAVDRSQQLISYVGDALHVLTSLWALVYNHLVRGNVEQAVSLAQKYVTLSERSGDIQQRVAAHGALGDCLHANGRLAEAQTALQLALSLYDPDRHGGSVAVFGFEPAVLAHGMLGGALWFRGYVERAMSEASAAVSLAETLNHPKSICIALMQLVRLHHYSRNRGAVREVAQQLLALSERQNMALGLKFAVLGRAWADRDVESAERALGDMAALGSRITVPYWGSTVAESEMDLGRLDAALKRLDGCVRVVEENQELHYLAEIYRLKGDCYSRGNSDAEAERWLREALAVARSQGARTIELRVSLDLARLWQRQGKAADAIELLARASDWFPEGQKWGELIAAQTILRGWRAHSAAA